MQQRDTGRLIRNKGLMTAANVQLKAGKWIFGKHNCCHGSSIVGLFLLCCIMQDVSFAYMPRSQPALFRGLSAAQKQQSSSELGMKKKYTDTPSEDIDPLAKTSWYVVEAFGNLFGAKKTEEETPVSLENPPQSLQETLQRIKEDYSRSYFLSGEVDALIYDEHCTFSDPFVSFDGRDRFISNLSNLGSFITKYSVRPLEFEEVEPTLIKTKVRLSSSSGETGIAALAGDLAACRRMSYVPTYACTYIFFVL